jgi:hypothetical protein
VGSDAGVGIGGGVSAGYFVGNEPALKRVVKAKA